MLFQTVVTILFITIVVVLAAGLTLIIRVKTLSVLQRNIYRFLITASVLMSLGILGYILLGNFQGMRLIVKMLPILLIGHLIYGVAEYIRIKWIIRLDEKIKRARAAGNLELAYTYHKRASILKKITFGHSEELTRAGIEY